jgi:hypothetical protein
LILQRIDEVENSNVVEESKRDIIKKRFNTREEMKIEDESNVAKKTLFIEDLQDSDYEEVNDNFN